MKEIILYKNKGIIFIDDDDYYLSKYNWYLDKDGYTITSIKIDDKWKNKKMHRLIMNEPYEMLIDHIDNNRLNNQKDNLRIVNNTQIK